MANIKSLGSPRITLILRAVTLLLLLASIVVLATDSAKVPALKSRKNSTTFNDFFSYRLMMYATAIGVAYTIVQLPFAVYHLISGKLLLQNLAFLYSDLLTQMVILAVLGSGIGAGYGTTYDIKTNIDELDNIDKALGDGSWSDMRSKLDTFFNMAYVSASLLLLGFICLAGSTVLSALSLYKRAKD